MLIRFYRNSHPSSFFTIPFIALLCWIPFVFLRPESFIVNVADSMPLYEWLYSGISRLHVWLQLAISWLLISIQAIYLNQLIVKHELFPRLTFLPALLFITLSVLFPEMMLIQPAFFVNLILLVVLDKVFFFYKNPTPARQVFDASFLLAVATLIDGSAITFYIYLLISLLILLPFYWRTWIISFVAFALPYYFMSVYFFLTDSLASFWLQRIPKALHFTQFVPPHLKPLQIATLCLLLLMFIFSVYSVAKNFYRNIIRIRRYFQLTFLFILFSLLSLLFTRAVSLQSISILTIPISIFLSYFLLQVKKKAFAEILFFLLVMFIILVRFG
jgi:hypothetical protein